MTSIILIDVPILASREDHQEKVDKKTVREQKKAEKIAEQERKKAEREHKRTIKIIKKAEADRLRNEAGEQKKILMEKKKAEIEEKKTARKFLYEKKKEENILKKKAFRQGVIAERERQKKKSEKQSRKFEIQQEAIARMVRVAKILRQKYPEGFTIKQCISKYIECWGKINPYTGEPVEEYDLHAAIRGFTYESSPSSEQHWFRYGTRKEAEQVSPCIFANKELATVNHRHGWESTTPEIAKQRRREKGLWRVIAEPNALYDWPEDKYGPLPTKEMLKEASKDRKIGIRGVRGRVSGYNKC